MSTNIVHKRTAVSGRSPTTSQLVYGELGINTVDGAIYLKINDGSDRIIEATKDRFIFDVVNNGTSAYDFSGVGLSADSNPTLRLQRGVTYEFHVNASGHPFYINTTNTTGTGSAYSDGVDNNGAETGIVTFTVPMDAPSILYYNCEVHSSMNGTIYVLSEDADTLDGQEGSYYLNYNNFSNTPTIPTDLSDLTDTTGLIPADLSDLTDTTGLIPADVSDLTDTTGLLVSSIDDLSDVDTSTTAPTTGQVLKWDGSKWAPGDDATSGGSGLDADTLDGQDGTYYLNYNNFTNTPTIPSSIDDLSDVDITSSAPTNGQVLKWNGSNFVPADDIDTTLTLSSASIGDLGDVDITTSAPTDGQALVWDAANSEFVPGTVGGSSVSSIDDLTDVDITTVTPTVGQVLKWDGSNFVPGNDIQGSGSGGSSGGGGFESKVYLYTISANTTSVSGADDNGDTLSFEGDRVEVYVNGVRLAGSVDYTASSGTTINFTETVFNGSIVEVVVLEFINGDEVTLGDTLPGTVLSMDATKFRTLKLIIQMSHSTNGYHATEVLLIHDGTTVYSTEYATVYSSASLGVVDATISGGLVTVTVAATTANTDVKTKILSIEV